MKRISRIGKYEFNSEEEAKNLISQLGYQIDEDGNSYATHPHNVYEIKFIEIERAEFDEEGNIIKESVKSDKYSVDIKWNSFNGEEPIESKEWKEFKLDLDSEGAFGIYGVSYLKNKI